MFLVALVLTTLSRGDVIKEVVDTPAVKGIFYSPKNETKDTPAVLVLHGSEGSTQFTSYTAAALAKEGYRTLALRYFGGENQSKHLVRIPIESMQDGFNWLANQPHVKKDSMGVIGFSRGAEAALSFAALNPNVRVVVAVAPTCMRFQGFISNWEPCFDAAFTWKSRDLPFAKLEFIPGSTKSIFEAALSKPSNAKAQIEVEKTNGPIMLLSGQMDPIWPSSLFAKEIKGRLTQSHFRHECEWLDYPNAGHVLLAPPSGNPTKSKPPIQFGGTEVGVGKAFSEAWPAMIRFLARAFNRPLDTKRVRSVVHNRAIA